jgi:hypothetical protein
MIVFHVSVNSENENSLVYLPHFSSLPSELDKTMSYTMGNRNTVCSPPFYIVSQSSGLVVDLQEGKTSSGTKVVLMPKNPAANTQLW